MSAKMAATHAGSSISIRWPKTPQEPPRPSDAEPTKAWRFACRLLYRDYTIPQADARCREIHGHCFDRRFVSGRFICYVEYL